jgi:3',5'-cyclic AMP phosphodiesterase CpdA
MPIMLPALSRRRFLKRAMAACAGAVTAPLFRANAKPLDEHSWALFSDIHLAADRTMIVRGVDMAAHFEQATKELLALPERPARLLITGDCAYNSGEKPDYELLAEFLQPIRRGDMPVILALGNHDEREHFWDVFAEERSRQKPVTDRQTARVSTPHANWFVLDSLDKTLSTPGRIGKPQLSWLAESLDANRDKPAMVVVHHNPGISGNVGLKDTQDFFEVIRPRRQVKAYIYGHTHNWNVEKDQSGLHLVNLPPVSYVFRSGDPSGWVHATTRADGMQLTFHCLDQGHKANGQVIDLNWRAG